MATQWGIPQKDEDEKIDHFKFNLSEVLKSFPLNEKIKMEVQTTNKVKVIVALAYKGPEDQYAIFSIVRPNDIQHYDNWGLSVITVHKFLRQKEPNFKEKPNNSANTICRYQTMFTQQSGS